MTPDDFSIPAGVRVGTHDGDVVVEMVGGDDYDRMGFRIGVETAEAMVGALYRAVAACRKLAG